MVRKLLSKAMAKVEVYDSETELPVAEDPGAAPALLAGGGRTGVEAGDVNIDIVRCRNKSRRTVGLADFHLPGSFRYFHFDSKLNVLDTPRTSIQTHDLHSIIAPMWSLSTNFVFIFSSM